MLDEIRRQVMVRIGSRREFARTWICDVSPRAMKRLNKNKIKSYSWQRIWNGDDGHEIISLKNMQVRHVVSLNNWTCTCKEWQVSDIPCRHAICVIYASHKHPEDYVSHLFRKEAYLRTYNHNILPIQGKNGWERLNKDLILPPPFKEKIGRPQTKRHKDKDEPKKVYGKASRKGRKMTCSLCKEQGHTKKTCPQRPRGTKNHNNSMGSGGWILNGERAISMQNASSFIQMHQATSHPYKEQPGTSSAQIKQQNCASSTSHITSRTSLLGHIYRGLQWKGHDAITGRELQEISAKKRKWPS